MRRRDCVHPRWPAPQPPACVWPFAGPAPARPDLWAELVDDVRRALAAIQSAGA